MHTRNIMHGVLLCHSTPLHLISVAYLCVYKYPLSGNFRETAETTSMETVFVLLHMVQLRSSKSILGLSFAW